MKLIKQLKDNPHEGIVKGDVRSVDEFSAATLIERGDAEAYDPDKAAAASTDEAREPAKYGGQEAETIDDIVDPEVARNRRTMTATIVGGPSGGAGATVAELADPAPATSDPSAPSGEGDTDPASTSTADPAQQSSSASTGGTSASPTGKAGKAGKGSEMAAPGLNPAGGDAGGGSTS